MGNKSSNINMSSRGVILYVRDPIVKSRYLNKPYNQSLQNDKPIVSNNTILDFIRGLNKNEIKS